jgi:hypothetical protein
MPVSDAFELLRSALERAGVRYAVGGSWASTAFGEPRFTNDIDILAEFTPESLNRFLGVLPEDFYVDADEAMRSVQSRRPFNAIHMPIALKFDFFPADGFAIGMDELDRAIAVADTGLSERPIPFVTPEDIVLAKLHWFRSGGAVSEVQWRDIEGLVRACGASLDRKYLEQGAAKVGVRDLLDRALTRS